MRCVSEGTGQEKVRKQMEVFPKDFEVGKVYNAKGRTVVWVRLNENRLLALRSKYSDELFFASPNESFAYDYHEISLDDLNEAQLKLYHEHFSKEEACTKDTCTCDSKDLFWHGCTCGWANRRK